MITVWTMFLLYGTRDPNPGSETIDAIFAAASVGGLIGAVISRKVIARFRIGRVYLMVDPAAVDLLGPLGTLLPPA